VLGKFPPTTPELCGVATVKIACDFGWTVLALICLIVPKSSSFKCAWKYYADKIIYDKWNANYTRKNLTTCQQAVDNLSTTRWEQAVENILFTSCWNSIATSLLQVCYNLCVFTCVYTVLCSLLNWRQLSMYIVQWSVPVDVTIATVTIECIHWNPTWRPKQGVKCQHDEIKSKI
jgi:hypothetical protein